MPPGVVFVFDRFALDPARRRLTADREPLSVPDRHLDVLLRLVAEGGRIVSKDDLIQAGWHDVAVGDNSLEQAISSLRRLLGPRRDGGAFIETVSRRGYRFAADVTRAASRERDEALDALLAPHRAFVEGRAALETLESSQIARAREVFERAVASVPDSAAAHVGLANACVMRFEMTRADPVPDVAALATAGVHAREACRLDPQDAEAWATLGFVLERQGERVDALAASKRATSLEPDNWRHHMRLGYVGWGEERLRAARRTLSLLPDFPLAHFLAATVHVGRQALPEAVRELESGLAVVDRSSASEPRFASVALHWLRGLLHLAAGEEDAALLAFERELALAASGQMYARECAANTCYAIGAVRLRHGDRTAAAAAFTSSFTHVAHHPLARVGLAIAEGLSPTAALSGSLQDVAPSMDAAMAHAVNLAVSGNQAMAAQILETALAAAAPGSAGWLIPAEPLLRVSEHPDAWAGVLARLRSRAA